ncbi:MAG: 1-acyl-sn-glycerol-3-phosphate acyltransferase [Bdellovibrio sp.]|nr:1-acyl-sn-glycerol-3-phosphate acyltransferase [Bdellovibrio sp.]
MKTLFIFVSTFKYFLKSYKKNASITKLKQAWALDILKRFNFEIKINNQPSSQSRRILVGNHVSYLDIIVLLAICPEAVFLSKQEVARWPIIGAAAKRIGTIFVSRDNRHARSEARQKIKNLFDNRANEIHLAGFPSGTTCLTESKPWKKGLFEIAQQSDVLVQPFSVDYFPWRECAYVDQDNLFLSLIRLFKTPNKKVVFSWGEAFYVTENIEQEIKSTQDWSRTRFNFTNKKSHNPMQIMAF